ncbi:ECF transporter S component [Leifsonia shinshuensis]|uniref:ECF transporter S component n=1 Tax=Leifsonia shinshuensis TaxID=150026 RepID=A0A7G6YEI5_9MICO|nr:ECF transporter S component [Leifsonia shinshuensis]QNE36900.1 ECF transporter S component [Leifsonia shinshuensis]
MSNPNRLARFFAGYGRLTIFLIPIGVATNFIGGQLANLLKLPIYLDSIGTVLVGALCGGLPGAVVGAVSNVINSITNPTTMAYAIISVVIGLLAGWFSRAGWFLKLWKALLTVIPFALVGGAGGALITIWLFGGLTPSGNSVIVAALHATGIDLNTAVYIAGIPFDMLDKLLTVLVVFLILKRVPERLLTKLPLGSIYRKSKPKSAASAPIEYETDDDLSLGR